MKSLSKKILAVLLAVLMTGSAVCISVFAAEDDPYAALKEGIGYVAIGDSFTRGYGAGENWQDEIYLNDTYGNFNCRNVAASYPNLVAQRFGLNAPGDIRDTSARFWPLAHDAVSTAYVLDLLGIDDGFRDEQFTYDNDYMIERYETDLRYFGDPLSYAVDGQAKYAQTGEIMSVREMLAKADLITIGLGQTDVIYKAQLYGLNTLDLSDIKGLPAGVANIVNLLTTYFKYWEKAYPLLLDYIKEVNPDAKVVLVGTLNPLKDATAVEQFPIEIGGLLNGIMTRMNTFTQKCACDYGYMYVDIADVETPTSITKAPVTQILSITDPIEYALIAHPTTKGYKQIADRVIAAVENDFAKDTLKKDFSLKTFFQVLLNFLKTVFSSLTALFA